MSIGLYSETLIFWLVEKKPPRVTNINFLQRISKQNQEKRLWELRNWSPKGKCSDLLWNSHNLFFMKMDRDRFGEFVSGYWVLKGSYWLTLWFCSSTEPFKISSCGHGQLTNSEIKVPLWQYNDTSAWRPHSLWSHYWQRAEIRYTDRQYDKKGIPTACSIETFEKHSTPWYKEKHLPFIYCPPFWLLF